MKDNEVWKNHKKHKFEKNEIMECIYDSLMLNDDNPTFDEYDSKNQEISNGVISFTINKKNYELTLKEVKK